MLLFAKFRNDVGGGLPRHGYVRGPRLILGLWSDGLVVRSENGAQGGAPYEQLSAGNVSRFESCFASVVEQARQPSCASYIVLDSDYRTCQVRLDGRWVVLESASEFGEGGHVRMNQNGLQAVLDAVDAAKFERETSDEFRRFRECWTQLAACVESALAGSIGIPFPAELIRWADVELELCRE
ncbi:MAG: hypothetical protein EPO68_17150 [Planctomycetota bacterium]|nr:MAG: hypothetical protein EPO68_17150 [Planctomycetota bacterium]